MTTHRRLGILALAFALAAGVAAPAGADLPLAGLVLSDGSVVPFLTRPISLVLWVTIAITVLLSFRRARTALARLLPGRASRGEVS